MSEYGTVLALEVLYEAVVARFADEGPDNVSQPFGWRYPAQQHVGPRIVWVPGNPYGAAGVSAPARNPGRVPRPLATYLENFYVIVSSQDESEPENERLQYRTTRILRDQWHRAVYLAAHGTFLIESEEWLTDKNERRFGTALLIVCTIEAAILDILPGDVPTNAFAPDGTGAEVDVSLLDVTEKLIVAPTDVVSVELGRGKGT